MHVELLYMLLFYVYNIVCMYINSMHTSLLLHSSSKTRSKYEPYVFRIMASSESLTNILKQCQIA